MRFCVTVVVIEDNCVVVSILVNGKVTEPIATPMTSMTTATAIIVGIPARVLLICALYSLSVEIVLSFKSCSRIGHRGWQVDYSY